MDYRCPQCGRDLGRKKLSHSIVARMDHDCPYCRAALSLNLHRSETLAVIAATAVAVPLALLSLALHSGALLVSALGVAMAGALAFYILERTWLRAWPRYAPRRPAPTVE
ncbi:MAG: hypothetical protein ACREU5_08490 [Burkholderiales bacterium]